MADVVEDLQNAANQDAAAETTGATKPVDFGEDFENLPEERVNELRSIIQELNVKRDQWARMVEIIRCTLRRYFWLGIQHGFWNADTQSLQIGPNGGSVENLNEEDLFAGDFNIYTQNGKIFIAVFSQSAAASRMEPDKPGDPASEKAAEEADKYVQVYQKYNPPKMAQQEVGRLFWTDGRVIAITETQDHPEIETTDDDGDPVPLNTELTEYFGVLETKCPLIQPFAEWPYLKVSKDKDILTAKYQNPKFRDKLETSAKGLAPNDEIARMSRIAVAENISQVSSDTLAYMVTEDRWWLRPSAFENLEEDSRKFWQQYFPKGGRFKFYGTVYCGAKAVSMNNQVRVMHAMPGEGNARPSLSDAMIPIQMEFNDAVGMYSEMIHKCIPRIWIDCGPEEIAAILEQVARYGEYSPLEAKTGQALQNSFFPEPQIEMPGGFEAWIENLQGSLAQFVTGNSPALFGQQMEDQKTATGYAQARDQSLGLMALVWVPYLNFAASIRGQAARCASKRDTDKISAVIPDAEGKSKMLSVDVAALRGGFLCTPVTDQNFPESWVETSNTWKQLKVGSVQDPDLAADFLLPENQRGFRAAIGLKDFKNRSDDSRALQLQEWADMQTQQGPVQDQEATAQRDQQKQQAAQQAVDAIAPGQKAPPLPTEPPVMRSTVPIDVETDDHVTHALTMFSELNSPDGQKIKKLTPAVWQDGKLHMMAHVAAAQAKGLVIPPPLGGAPPMPALPPNPGAGAGPVPTPSLTGENNNASASTAV